MVKPSLPQHLNRIKDLTQYTEYLKKNLGSRHIDFKNKIANYTEKLFRVRKS